MPYIEKRGKNNYRITVSDGRDRVTGKEIRYRKKVKAKNKREAQKLAVQFEAEVKRGEYIDIKNITMGEYLLKWIKVHGINLKVTTLDSYKMIIEKHLIPAFGNISIEKLLPITVQEYYTDKLQTLSKRTVEYHHTILKKALKDAVGQFITRNPCDLVKPPRTDKLAQKEKTHFLTYDELAKLLASLRDLNKDLYYAVYFTAGTGLRRGELLGLRWRDVSFKKRFLKITQTVLVNPKGGVLFTTPKTKKASEPIELTDENICILKDVKKIQAQNKLLLGHSYQDNNLIFCKSDGTPLHPNTFSDLFRRITRKLGFELRFHDLRHTHATLLLAEGVNPKILQERLRHTIITTTLDSYSHLMENMQRGAVEKMEKSLKIALNNN